MINFLRNLFGKKEEEVKLEELEEWFNRNVKPGTSGIKEGIEEIKNAKERLEANLEALKKVEIKQNVQQKVKDVVLGNVPAYIRVVEIFLEKIEPPEELSSQNTTNFYETIQKELDQFGKKTARNFAIMQTLIGEELAATAKDIKKIDEASKKINREADGLKKFEDAKEAVSKAGESKKNEKDILEMKKRHEDEKSELEKQLREATKSMEALEVSKEAKELDELKKETSRIETKKKEKDHELLSLFSPLQKAFKRYNNIFYIKKVEDYINNSAEALKQDREMEITKYLKDVKNMIKEGKIELKEDKKKKALESLEKLDEAYLKKFIEEHETLEGEIKTIREKEIENKYEKERESLEKQKQEKEKRLELVKKEIERMKEVNIRELVTQAEKSLKELGHEVKINAVD